MYFLLGEHLPIFEDFERLNVVNVLEQVFEDWMIGGLGTEVHD